MATSGYVSKTVKSDGIKINCLNPASVNGAMLNLNKNWIDLASMLQYSNDQIIIFLGNNPCKFINFDSFLE